MSQPNVGSNNVIVSDVQTQSQLSGFITVFEVEIPGSDIGGGGVDKLYFHDGANGTADVRWLSLKEDSNFGSSTLSHYGEQTYSAFPVESEGWEVRGSGTGSLARPTIRFANINQYWNAHLSDYDDLVGAKVTRRRTLAKYVVLDAAPVEFNRDVYYIERKSSETPILVEFELTSAFDVQGIKLPRRSIIAARCPWKYKDSDQGGCDWPSDNRFTIDGTEQILYFDKDDVRITTHPTWGRQDVSSNRTSNLYAATSYALGDYVEFYRPIGGLIAAVGTETTPAVSTGANVTYTGVDTGHGIEIGDFVIAKGFTDADANFKSVPLYVSGKTSTTVTVQNPSATITSSSGFLQLTRVTLYKCITAHSIAASDSVDDIIKPTNISFWEFGDVCGKRLNSCAIRYGHNPAGTGVTSVIVDKAAGAVGGGSGYSAVPAVTFSGGGGSGAAATAVIGGGKVTAINITAHGTGYTSAPTVAVAGNATATAQINNRGTRNVSLPFGGFPGAALY